MRKRRRVFTPEFKAKTAIGAIRSDLTTAQFAATSNVAYAQVYQWKRLLLENAVKLFEPTIKKRETVPTTEIPVVEEPITILPRTPEKKPTATTLTTVVDMPVANDGLHALIDSLSTPSKECATNVDTNLLYAKIGELVMEKLRLEQLLEQYSMKQAS